MTMATTPYAIQQAAAIPIRSGRVCLVTSSSGKRWVVPKGCLERGTTAGQIALQEAWEEAGLAGVLQPQPAGSYVYQKWGFVYHVTVFLMEVTKVAAEWPECKRRRRCWLTPAQALRRINDQGLREVIRAVTAEI